jgi:hypothetical protein
MRSQDLSHPDHAPLLAFSISSVTEPNPRVKDLVQADIDSCPPPERRREESYPIRKITQGKC